MDYLPWSILDSISFFTEKVMRIKTLNQIRSKSDIGFSVFSAEHYVNYIIRHGAKKTLTFGEGI